MQNRTTRIQYFETRREAGDWFGACFPPGWMLIESGHGTHCINAMKRNYPTDRNSKPTRILRRKGMLCRKVELSNTEARKVERNFVSPVDTKYSTRFIPYDRRRDGDGDDWRPHFGDGDDDDDDDGDDDDDDHRDGRDGDDDDDEEKMEKERKKLMQAFELDIEERRQAVALRAAGSKTRSTTPETEDEDDYDA